MGRAAVATNYSGNLDFMTPDTSLLVDCDLVPVAKDAYLFGEGQVWAEPSVDHAVELIGRLVDDRRYAQALGERARRHMRTHFSARAIGLRYLARLEELGKTPPAASMPHREPQHPLALNRPPGGAFAARSM